MMNGCKTKVRSMWITFVVASFFLICQGCGSSGVELAPCRGTVEYDGSPITSGKLLLTPNQKGPAALARLEPDGSFQVATVQLGEGAVPGHYRITVVSDMQYKGKESHVTCTSPKQSYITVEAGQENVFSIVVSEEDGWQIIADE